MQLEVKELNRKLYNLVGEYIKDDDFNHNKVDDFLNQNREVKETKKGDFKILILYLVGKKLCNKYFQDIYKILGSTFDKQI
ncbi:MAG: hypothetical protein ORN26_02330 [Candidatus Pacebacteria bacterium]|nr:hypothetical protein [Candidatus Paceibacterota bacterium]